MRQNQDEDAEFDNFHFANGDDGLSFKLENRHLNENEIRFRLGVDLKSFRF